MRRGGQLDGRGVDIDSVGESASNLDVEVAAVAQRTKGEGIRSAVGSGGAGVEDLPDGNGSSKRRSGEGKDGDEGNHFEFVLMFGG